MFREKHPQRKDWFCGDCVTVQEGYDLTISLEHYEWKCVVKNGSYYVARDNRSFLRLGEARERLRELYQKYPFLNYTDIEGNDDDFDRGADPHYSEIPITEEELDEKKRELSDIRKHRTQKKEAAIIELKNGTIKNIIGTQDGDHIKVDQNTKVEIYKRVSMILEVESDYAIVFLINNNGTEAVYLYKSDLYLSEARKTIDSIWNAMPFLIIKESDSEMLWDEFGCDEFGYGVGLLKENIPEISKDDGVTCSNQGKNSRENRERAVCEEHLKHNNSEDLSEEVKKTRIEKDELKAELQKLNEIIRRKDKDLVKYREEIDSLKERNMTEKKKYEAEIKKREQEYDKLKTGFEEFVREKLRKKTL